MNDDDPKQRRKNVLPDPIIPFVALAFTIYYLTTITEVPWIAQASAITVSCLLFAAIAAYFIRTAYRIRHGSEVIALPGPPRDLVVSLRRAGLLVLTIAYVALIDSLGFTLTTSVFIFLGIVVLSSWSNWKAAALVSIACSVIGYVVFIYIFETRFPRGPIENALQGLF